MRADELVFLVDVDNTLIDNDRFESEFRGYLEQKIGTARRDLYLAIQEQMLVELGYRDYLGAFQRYRSNQPKDASAIWLPSFLVDYAFADLLYPGALEVLARMRSVARVAILTDGDAVFQPRKIERAGIAEAVDREAIVCVHKEKETAEIERRYPAQHYVVVDDKLELLTAFKEIWGDRVTTVFPRQGQFARDEKILAANPPADVTVAWIGDLLQHPILAR